MLHPKKVKGLFLNLGLITILLFAYSIAKMFCADYASADHPLATYFAALFYTVYALGALLTVVVLLRSVTYVGCSENKSRGGMVLSFGLIVSSLSAVILGWFLSIGMMVTGTYSFAFSGFIDDTQIFNVLPIALCFSLVYRTTWSLCKPLGQKFIINKRQKLDTIEKRQGYRRYLQLWGLLFSFFTLSLMPISLHGLEQAKVLHGFPRLPEAWYLSAGLHGASVIIAGCELLVGIGLLMDQSKEKVTVGALLLGSSSVGFFTIWFCYLLIAAVVFNWGFGNYNVYIGSMLFVILHRITSVILLVLTLMLSRRKSGPEVEAVC